MPESPLSCSLESCTHIDLGGINLVRDLEMTLEMQVKGEIHQNVTIL